MIDLSERLPYSIEYNGQQYKLCPAYDNILRMYRAIEGIDDMEQVDIMLYFLIDGSYPLDINLLQAIINLIFPKARQTGQNARSFDFQQDAQLIYASFYQAYGMDLFEQQGKLHWWSFMALLNGLPSDTKLSEVISIRTRPIPKATRYNARERNELLRLKHIYALHISEEERQQNLQTGLAKIAQCLISMAQKG